MGITISFVALLVAAVASVGAFYLYLENSIHTTSTGAALDLDSIASATVDREAPEDPFWFLLVGTDVAEEIGGGIVRSDTIILARIDPAHKNAALVSIPRDTKVTIPGYGTNKINAAYTYGAMESDEGHSGAEFTINAVSSLTGVAISGYAQVDLGCFKLIVDGLGGVEVDVPVDIIGDANVGYVDVYAGPQVLDGDHAMAFVRSRQYAIGDYQRQANQRIMLQAMAKKILNADPVTIVNTVSSICMVTASNYSISDIVALALSLQGMQETDIYTYSIPSEITAIDDISYVVADTTATRQLFQNLENGIFPDASEWTYQGEVPDEYKAATSSSEGTATATAVTTSDYLIAVRNGYGIDGSATAVSDKLALAGYIQGEIGNANSFVYEETLIIYREDTDRDAALDIQNRLGYGRVIPSLDRYLFDGDILVVVGGDFQP